MSIITLEIDKKKHLKLFLNFLKGLNFPVKIISSDYKDEDNNFNSNFETSEINPDELFGIWEGKDITLEKIREKAWKRN
ncbi:MAG: hypothetical protein K8R54_13085 [Bacteroidales bacterium]|nr:hypothetical protein [Bacteroidales bacterium]